MNIQPVIRRLGPDDIWAMRGMNALFAEMFEDRESYANAKPDDAYLADLLCRPGVFALAALEGERIVGGLVAYELPKLEQARSEIYIYDLAVAEDRWRQGIATRLIGALRALARDCGAWVIYVQADYGDEPAITLYTKLGIREDVMHFDIAPAQVGETGSSSGPK